jgi:hypothetical protein
VLLFFVFQLQINGVIVFCVNLLADANKWCDCILFKMVS